MTRRSTRGGVQLTTDKVIPVIYEQYGNLAAVARKLGTSRQHMYTFVNQHTTVQQALADARESMLDNAESSLYKQALDGNVTALIFFLKTQGYKRGYVEKHEHSGPDGKPMQVQADNTHEFDFDSFRGTFAAFLGGTPADDEDSGESVDTAHSD